MMWVCTAYFIAVMTLAQVFLGVLGLIMIATLTGGRWFETSEDGLRKTLRYFPILSLSFLPMLWFLPHQHSEQSGLFFNPVLFDLRAMAYWILWNLWAWKMRRPSGRVWAGLGLLMLLFTITFASIDWIMMLDREWLSSALGVNIIADSLMAGLAFMIVMTFKKKIDAQPIGDFANLLLMSTLLWIYMHYMEYLVIWQGQIPREIRWYDTRFADPYLVVVWGALVLSFVVPFPILLFKKLKQNPVWLMGLAYGALLARVFEMHAMIEPTQGTQPWPTLALGALLSIAAFSWLLSKANSRD